jgi:hypothetical protein
MSEITRHDDGSHHCDRAGALDRRARRIAAVFEAPFGVALRAQDTPRAWIANNCRLTTTRLAKPNRLNSCAVFFARPL